MIKYLLNIRYLLIYYSFGIAQAGWIEQEVDPSITGQSLVNCGDNLIIYTKANSNIVYFFDTRSSEWQTVTFTSTQNFKTALADHYTAFTYSDEYIVAYSSIRSQWDTIKYQGSVLDPSGVSVRKGYGCSCKLAYFATTANRFYVFDDEQAQWKTCDYGIVLNASGTNSFWAADTFAKASGNA